MKKWRFVLAALMLCIRDRSRRKLKRRATFPRNSEHTPARSPSTTPREIAGFVTQPEQCRVRTSPCSTFKISGGKDPSGRTARKITESILTSLQILLPHE